MKKVTTLANRHDMIVDELAELMADLFKDYLGLDPEKIDMNDINSFNTGILKDWGAIDEHPELFDQSKRFGTIMIMKATLEREKCLSLDRINRKLDKIIKLLKEEGS